MKKVNVFLLSWVLIFTPSVYAWNDLGHKVIIRVAETLFSKTTQVKVKNILGNEYTSLSKLSTMADGLLKKTRWKDTKDWHKISFSEDMEKKCNYWILPPVERGDLIFALVLNQENLKKPHQVWNGKRVSSFHSLAFLAHLVGDLHQPFHVGNLADQNGVFNPVFLPDDVYPWKRVGLHQVWDEVIAKEKLMKMGFSLDAYGRIDYKHLDQITERVLEFGKNHSVSTDGTYLDWIYETRQHLPFATNLPGGEPGPVLNEEYLARSGDLVFELWYKAGVRLAHELNSIFENREPTVSQAEFTKAVRSRFDF